MFRLLIIRRVVGHSMLPTLRPRQIVIATGLKRPVVGSIVIAKIGNKEIIKRVSAIKNGRYYLVGDNPDDSRDSREFGFVDESQIIARKLFFS